MPKKTEKKVSEKQKEEKKPEEKSLDEPRERDLYLNQIQYLTDQLERYQLKCEDLEGQRTDFVSRYSSLEKEKNDIVEYLKRCLLEKEDEVEDMSQKLERQRQEAETDRDALEQQHAQETRGLQEQIEELSGDNRTLETNLLGLEEFRVQREQLMSNMESLEQQLRREQEAHRSDLHDLEMAALLEKKRLETQMENHEVNMVINVQRLVDLQIPEETKRALKENTELQALCTQLSERAELLIRENAALQNHKSEHRVDSDIWTEMNRDLSRQVCTHKKVVKQVTEQSEQLQAELSACRREQQQLQAEHEELLVQMEALRRDRASPSARHSQDGADASRLQAELQEARGRSSRMRSVIQEAVDTLRQTLTDVLDERDSKAVPGSCRQLMQKLLVMLDTPTLAEDPTSDPAAARSLNPWIWRS